MRLSVRGGKGVGERLDGVRARVGVMLFSIRDAPFCSLRLFCLVTEIPWIADVAAVLSVTLIWKVKRLLL